MEREPSGFPFLEINNILTQLKCLQLVKKWFYHFFDKLRTANGCPFLYNIQAVEKVLPPKGFGGKDSWKGNRQGSLSL